MEIDNGKDLPKGIGQPATRAFVNEGIVQLEQFQKVTEKDMLKLDIEGADRFEVSNLRINRNQWW